MAAMTDSEPMTDREPTIEDLAALIKRLALRAEVTAPDASSLAAESPSGDETPEEWVALRTVSVDEFVGVDEPGAGSVLGPPGAPLIGEGGNVMVYGDYGVGKTTLVDDLGFHVAAGDPWLGIPVPKPRRVLIIENESPRAHYRKKLGRKKAAWKGSPLDDRLRIYDHPWGRFSFADPEQSRLLAAEIAHHGIDVVIVGPLTSVGFDKPGTIPETREFGLLVDKVRDLSGRPVVFVLVHHENARGKVSGAWGGVGEALLHVTAQGRGKLRLYIEKARWSSELHQTGLQLAWAEGDSFTVEEKPELDDEAVAELIVVAVGDDPGIGWTKVEKATPGVGDHTRRRVRDQLLREGVIVNVGKDENGVQVALDHCPPKKAAHLYPAEDPTIRHLRLRSAAVEPQSAAAGGDGGNEHLRPAAGLKEPQAAEPQLHTPLSPAEEDEIERLAARAREFQEGR
jgi:hypothetical protein